jgi:hypothetical protein
MKQHGLILLALVALSLMFYAQTINNPFWDAEDFNFLEKAMQIGHQGVSPWSSQFFERHHPVPLLLFWLEYEAFALKPAGYYVVNLVLNGLNAFLVYWLVTVLIPDRRIALLSGALFAVGVGSYGKAVMNVAGVENLLITALYLLILNLYIRNDLQERGRILTWRYALVLLLFLTASFAKPTAFSLVGCLLAYKFFFRGERGRERRVLEPNLLILVVGAVVFWVVRELAGMVDLTHTLAGTRPLDFMVNVVKNMGNYLIHMFFPIHASRLVNTANPVVQAIYKAAPVLRWVIGLGVVSYSLFGFVFGNRTLRFFLVWTLITLIPYSVLSFPADWANIGYLYSVAIGFVFIMAAGTVLSIDLLHRRRWRRLVPLVFPALFVLLSGYITDKLDTKYEADGQSAGAHESLQRLTDMRAQAGARGRG